MVTMQALKRALVITGFLSGSIHASRIEERHSGIAYRRSEKLAGNQFLIATYAPPCQKAGVVPSFENLSLRAFFRGRA